MTVYTVNSQIMVDADQARMAIAAQAGHNLAWCEDAFAEIRFVLGEVEHARLRRAGRED